MNKKLMTCYSKALFDLSLVQRVVSDLQADLAGYCANGEVLAKNRPSALLETKTTASFLDRKARYCHARIVEFIDELGGLSEDDSNNE